MWVYYEYEAPEGGVLDVRRMNDNFAKYAALQAAGLGEHAWGAGFVNTVNLVQQDIALRHRGSNRDVNPNVPANRLELENSGTWEPVDRDDLLSDYFRRTFTSRGGLVYVEISFAFGTGVAGVTLDAGLNFCIEVDGVVQNDTVIGSGDIGGDDIRAGGSFVRLPSGSTPFPDSNGYGPAVRMFSGGLTLSWIGRLGAGQHTVTLAYRNPMPATDPGSQGVLNGEINVLELWA